MYRESFRSHGDSPAAILTPKGRNAERYSVLETIVKNDSTILDFGCGLGYLYDYITSNLRKKINYTGYDIVPEFIERSSKKFPAANFQLIQPDEVITEEFEIVFASGVFNLAFEDDQATAKQYALSRLSDLFDVCSSVLVCDFLSEFVDFKQDRALHFSCAEIADYCSKNFGNNFHIRHDILPYEFTLVVWKNQKIIHPQNIYDRLDGN